MKSFYKSALAGLVMSAAAFAASAATIVDFSPETTGVTSFFNAGNVDAAQNWGTLFSLSEETTLSAIDRYATPDFSDVGDAAIVKIWTSDGATLLHDISTMITVQDSDGAAGSGLIRSRAVFDVDLTAGDYLIGLTGAGSDQLQQSLLQGTLGDLMTFRFFQDTLQDDERTASIRVFGDAVTAVPLPAGLPLLLGALAVIGVAARRRSA